MLKNIFFANNQEEDKSRIAFGESPEEADSAEAELPVDLIRAGNKFIIRTPIVGANANDISITLENNRITIFKNSLVDASDDGEYFYLQECHWGALSRAIDLPKDIDPDAVRASLEDGILTITLPLLHKAYTKVINVKENSS